MWREQSARKEVEHERNNKGKQRTKNKTKTGKNQKSFPVKVLSSWLKESFSLKKKKTETISRFGLTFFVF